MANAAITALNALCASPMHPFPALTLFSSVPPLSPQCFSLAQARLVAAIHSRSCALMHRCRSRSVHSVDAGACFAAIHRAVCSRDPLSFSFSFSDDDNFSFLSDPAFDFAQVALPYAVRGTALSLIADKVSLPSSLARVPMLELLPPALRELYAQPSPRLLLPETQVAQLRAQLRIRRGTVFASRTEYVRLVARLHSLGMVAFTSSPKAVNGAFAVVKDVDKQRFILAAQPANVCFRQPPKVRLPNPAHFVSLHVPAGKRVFVAKADLSNFYHQLLIPSWLRDYFAMPALTAAELRLLGASRDGSARFPVLCTLPMGFNHAVFIAQAVHETVLQQAGFDMRRSVINLSVPTLVDAVFGAYIDDLHNLALSAAEANGMLERALAAYARVGLPVAPHKVCWASEAPDRLRCQELIGLELDGERCTLSASTTKLVQLLVATLSLLRSGACSGRDLLRVVGGWTWFCMLQRPLLSLMHACHRFVALAGDRVFQLWPSVRAELLCLAAMVPFLSVSLRAPLGPEILATDASMEKEALTVAALPPSADFAELLWPLVSCRSADMLPHGEPRSPTPRPLIPRVDGEDLLQPASLLPRPLLQLDAFCSAFGGLRWRTIISARWQFAQHINLLELHALLSAVRWLLSRPSALGSRWVCLLDNSVTALVVKKGRANARPLQSLFRVLALHLLAGDLRLLPVWIPSATNPADRPSRE